jgi:hypothetical protein
MLVKSDCVLALAPAQNVSCLASIFTDPVGAVYLPPKLSFDCFKVGDTLRYGGIKPMGVIEWMAPIFA